MASDPALPDRKVTGVVFNIQKFSVHDGRGIRTLVFLKGCPLRCKWCSNPESLSFGKDIAFSALRCLGVKKCGRCLPVCPSGALRAHEDGERLSIDRTACTACFACADACPTAAQTVYGQAMTVDAVVSRAQEDAAFYARSGGGLTLSGGEPLAQPKFALAILREARRRRLKTAMETSLFVAWDHLRAAGGLLNEIMVDLKSADPARHIDATGVSNSLILNNFSLFLSEFPDLPVRVRTPVIPGVNDRPQDILAILALFPAHRANLSWELLDYHRMGQPKYQALGLPYPMDDVKSDPQKMTALRALVPEQWRIAR